MIRFRTLALLVGFTVAAAVWAESPDAPTTTAPVAASAPAPDDGGEMMADKGTRAAYGAESYRIVSEKDEIVSVLRNGMTVIVKRIPSPVVAVRGLIGTGGVYEGKWLGGGLSHLLEHLVCGGSNDRRDQAEDLKLLEQIGNNSNAYTTEDRTAFFVNTTVPHAAEAVDLVTGWLLGAKITPEEYKREYMVVQRELEMGQGDPSRQFAYMAAMNRYHVNPARVPVIGYQEVIQGLSRDDVYNYYQLAYEPHNMIFTVVGNLEPEAMLAMVRKNVSDFKPKRIFTHDIPNEPPVLGPRTLVATFPKLGQAQLELGFEGVKMTDPDMYALDLLSMILGGGDSSILTQQLRDEKQMVSGISANDDTPTYASGTFTVDMQLDPDKVDAATAATLDILESLKTKPVDEDRIKRAKTQMRVARVKQMQTAEDISTSLADDYMNSGDIHFSDRYVDRINEVTARQLQAVARKYFYKSRLITTLMLPTEYVGAKGLPKAEDLIRGAGATTKPSDIASVNPVEDPVHKTDLGNGVTLLVKRITTSPMVSIGMYSLGGVTEENADNNGIGNLTMSLLTRGTKTRSAEQISEFFDTIGGTMDAGCGNNSWSWSASCLTADFDKTMDVYADVVKNPAFADAEVAAMKKRVDAEIASEDADWEAQSMRFFKHEFYGPSKNPYQFLPIGSAESVDKLTAEDLKKWYETKVTKGHRVLAIYGDVDPKHAEDVARKLIGEGPSNDAGGPAKSVTGIFDAEIKGPEIKPTPSVDVTAVKVQKTEQALAGVVIGFKADSIIGDPQNFPLTVGQTMAGGYGYPTGYLFETLRGKGLVYVVEDQNITGRDAKMPGTFMVFAGCEPSKVNEVVDGILLNIARLQGTPADVQPDWFDRSKLLITTSDAMDSETPAAQMANAALDELFGLGYDYHAQFDKSINAVTLDQVRQAAATRLKSCVVTISTPMPEAVKVETGKREYKEFPPVDLTPRGVQHSQDVQKP